MFPSAFLGDLSQGIHSYRGVERWDDVREHVFDDGRSRYLTLEQSYRTTIEIMEAANRVIARLGRRDLVPAKPVIRHGERVQVVERKNAREIAADIAGRLRQLSGDGFKSAAVICKSTEECKTMLSLLKGGCPGIYMITGKEKEYKGGIVIVPSHLAKGLEFDAVMVSDAGAGVYTEDELDIKLLYVAMTRALHRLYIYYAGEPSPLLAGI